MSIKQVTVFGGSGFVGRAIVRALAQQGYLVRVACRRIELAEPVKTAGDVGQITLMRANLRNARLGRRGGRRQPGRDQCRRHLRSSAAASAIRRSMSTAPARSPKRPAPPASQRLVHISGIGADNRSSKNRYVQSKVEAEDAVIAGFDSATILRPSVVFGPDDAMFNRMAAIAAKAPFVPVVGDGSAQVQPVFVGDVGKAAVAVLAQPGHGQERVRAGRPARLQLSRDRRPRAARDRPPASRSSACRPA